MAPRVIDYAGRRAFREEARGRVAAIEAGFAEPYRRERPRAAAEACLLRERGTPERLIGPSSEEAERRAFAAPPATGFFAGVDLSLLDPADEDERAFLIRAEHRDLAAAIERGQETIFVNGEEINPRLHLTIHEVLAAQLWDDDPPEVWQTARRLRDAGYERHEILHMLGSALIEQLWHTLGEREEFDRARYRRALAALPGSWEAGRPEASTAPRMRRRRRRR